MKSSAVSVMTLPWTTCCVDTGGGSTTQQSSSFTQANTTRCTTSKRLQAASDSSLYGADKEMKQT